MTNTDIWFNSNMWFDAKDVTEVTTSKKGAYVRLNTGDEYDIVYLLDGGVSITRTRGGRREQALSGKKYAMQQVARILDYRKRKAHIVRGWTDTIPPKRITALVEKDGSVRLLRHGDTTYRVADQERFDSWDDFVEIMEFVDSPEKVGNISAIDLVENHEVETDGDSSSDYVPENEVEQRPPPNPIVRIRMAVGGTDENIGGAMCEVLLNLEGAETPWNTPGLTHVSFKNGAQMSYGRNQITYTRQDGTSVYAEWATPHDLFSATMYFIERGDWEGVRT